jgi:amidohydrolase family protein
MKGTLMRKFCWVPLIAAFVACATTQVNTAVPTHGVAYRGGMWFDGSKFAAKTMYVVDGVLRTRAPTQVDSTVDLAGGYVVPPFADAHQHFIDPRIDQTIRTQLAAGVFYVKDHGNSPLFRRLIDPALNRPTSVDFISANQGWTAPSGHPVEVIKRGLAMGPPIADMIRDSLDPGLVNQVASVADIDRRWSYFLGGKPDFVKVFLFRSDDSALRANPAAEGRFGIDPALVPEIVKRARAAGLEVSAHVFTSVDFRNAVNGGVQLIAHLPGGRGPDSIFMLTEADAKAARQRGVTVITTVVQHEDSALLERLLKTQYANNINLLRRHGVPLLIGSDLMGRTAAIEIAALAHSGLFTNLELLRMWSVTTPRAIFPKRRIGELRDGYEASFLVLRADPLKDIEATRAIALRVKQGVRL